VTPSVQRGGPQHIPRPAGARAGRPAPWADLSPTAVDLRVDTVARLVGELDHLTTVASRFVVAPYVGVLPGGRPEYRPNAAEIDRAFDVPLRELLDPAVYVEEVWDFPWGERHVSFFLLEGETVWGATARILRQLLLLITGTTSDDDGRPPL
jgi:hypothetical protein